MYKFSIEALLLFSVGAFFEWFFSYNMNDNLSPDLWHEIKTIFLCIYNVKTSRLLLQLKISYSKIIERFFVKFDKNYVEYDQEYLHNMNKQTRTVNILSGKYFLCHRHIERLYVYTCMLF